MQTYVRGYCERATTQDAKAGSSIRFKASTDGIARDKYIIDSDAWMLDSFRSNAVFLWVHDYMGQRAPIGRVETVEMKDGALWADVVFDQEDEFARQVESKYRRGFLNAVSVGWDTHAAEPTNNPDIAGRITKAELLDISAVPVPGDPGALMERQKRALAVMAKEILDEIEPPPLAPIEPIVPNPNPESSARATWEDIAPQMVRLMTPFAQRPDDERKADWQRLVREYERLRKTPPEFITQSDLDALGVDEVRGVFLEGEPESFASVFDAITTRAGAVLSQRNRSDLDQAIALITGVLERSKSTKPADDEPTDDERAAVFLQELANGLAEVAA